MSTFRARLADRIDRAGTRAGNFVRRVGRYVARLIRPRQDGAAIALRHEHTCDCGQTMVCSGLTVSSEFIRCFTCLATWRVSPLGDWSKEPGCFQGGEEIVLGLGEADG